MEGIEVAEGIVHGARLRDVASRAGVSVATASRALNGLPVSARNRARVHAAARELAYVANEPARNLRVQRTRTIGLIFYKLGLRAGVDLLESLTQAVEARGYSLLVSTTRGDAAQFETLLRRFLERRVDAVLLVHPNRLGPIVERYRAARVPILALLSRGSRGARVPVCSTHWDRAMGEAVAHLAGLGHRRLALIGSNASRGPGTEHSLRTACAERGLELEVEPIDLGNGPELAAYARRLRADPAAPTAVFSVYPIVARLQAICEEMGIDVPGDLSLCAVTDGDHAALMRVPLSVVDLEIEPLVAEAVALLFGALDGEPPPDATSIDATRWIERSTTGPVRPRPGAPGTGAPSAP